MLKFIGVIILAALLSACAHDKPQPFTNSEINYSSSWSQLWEITKAYWQDTRKHARPADAIPVMPIDPLTLQTEQQDAIFKLGHSSVLLRIDGELVLIDPVFSERASAVQWIGPKRFHQPPIAIADLPEIAAVIISHDHYDHLDKNAIQQLISKTKLFVTPLRVGKHLQAWGVPEYQIVELNWWQNTKVAGIEFIATPSQHFSGRSLTDRDQTLWASWVIKGWDTKLFYSGDSGYFSGFKEIGQKYGPFDVTLIETGAYNELWADIHMMPEQSLQAHIDLQGKVLMPVHNGTFDLSLHDWFEPLEAIHQIARANDVRLATPIFGQAFAIKSGVHSQIQPNLWWQPLMPQTSLNSTSITRK